MAGRAGVYEMSDLKIASHGKNPKDWVVEDLLMTPRTEATERHAIAIVEGNKVTLMGPTTNLGLALESVRVERDIKGI